MRLASSRGDENDINNASCILQLRIQSHLLDHSMLTKPNGFTLMVELTE